MNAAVRGLRLIYQPGYQLSKAGVMLQDLCPADIHQGDLLFEELGRDQSKLMEAMDSVNARFGKGTVHVASTGVPEQDESGWRMRQERRTPRYTTKIDDIPIARA